MNIPNLIKVIDKMNPVYVSPHTTLFSPKQEKFNIQCKGSVQQAALQMLLNNLDPSVAENPDDLIVYGGRGKAARNKPCLDVIIKGLKNLENDETLLIQ